MKQCLPPPSMIFMAYKLLYAMEDASVVQGLQLEESNNPWSRALANTLDNLMAVSLNLARVIAHVSGSFLSRQHIFNHDYSPNTNASIPTSIVSQDRA